MRDEMKEVLCVAALAVLGLFLAWPLLSQDAHAKRIEYKPDYFFPGLYASAGTTSIDGEVLPVIRSSVIISCPKCAVLLAIHEPTAPSAIHCPCCKQDSRIDGSVKICTAQNLVNGPAMQIMQVQGDFSTAGTTGSTAGSGT